MPRAVRPVGVVVVLALSILGGTASWAQQKPGSGTNTQSATPQATCTPQKLDMCKQTALTLCGSDPVCIRKTTDGCVANCGGVR